MYGKSVLITDYNCDGRDDLVVLAQNLIPNASEFPYVKRGRLYFYMGRPYFNNNTDTLFTITRRGITDSLGSIYDLISSDLNGDGFKDVIGIQMYHPPSTAPYESGLTVFYSNAQCDTIPDFQYMLYNPNLDTREILRDCQNLGDINGDGCEDVGFTRVIRYFTSWSLPILYDAEYYILYGDPVSPHVELLCNLNLQSEWYLYPKMRGIGNINNDAFDDFLITYRHNEMNRHINAVIYGNTVIDTLITDEQLIYAGDDSGSYCGDMNGDGVDDFVGVWGGRFNPKVWFGGNFNFSQPSLILDSPASGCLGFSHGDLNGDGYEDLIFGDDNMFNHYGRFCISLGDPYPNSSTDLIIDPPVYVNPYTFFGRTTSTGDLNCDGYDDIAVSACDPGGSPYSPGTAYVYAGNANLTETTVSVDDSIPPASGLSFKAYPNPFNPNIYFELKNAGKEKSLKIDIFNLKGQKVDSIKLNGGQIKKGKVLWQANNMPSGIYICQLKANDQIIASRKVTLLK